MKCNKFEIFKKNIKQNFCWNNKGYKREYKNENFIKSHYIDKNMNLFIEKNVEVTLELFITYRL